MAKKLYSVTIEVDIVVSADDECDAEMVAEDSITEVIAWDVSVHGEMTATDTKGICLNDWANCIPFGQQENGAEQTVKQLLDAAKESESV